MRNPAPPRRGGLGLAILGCAILGPIGPRPAPADDAPAPALPPPAAKGVDFAGEIRPILEASCYSCHGPKKQKADFRLDDRAAALRGGTEGPAILPGKSAESDLILRVAGAVEADKVMPPRDKGDRLTPGQVSLLRAWIDQGATWPDASAAGSADKRNHWAFKAPARPDLPPVKAGGWVRNPLDRFILARLEREHLAPAAEADRATLIRRLSLDLLGLPPTIAEVDAFLADPAPDAYDKLVGRLLASPHYGERWGRHWLDAARYADSDGFEKDKPRYIYFYRDWVINALNRDLPYDRFIIEQLAGDQLPDPTQDQVVATGFLRNSMVNEEGGVDPEQFRMEAMFDRMEAIGKGILGLTIQCAQCHNHKYDPITQEDYYRVFAFLNSDDEPARVAYTPDQQMIIADLRRQVGAVEAQLRESAPDWTARLDRWEDELAKVPQPRWKVIQAPFEDISTGGQKYLMQPDGSYLAQGYAPTKHTGQVTVKVDLPKVTAIRLELMTDPNLPAYGPGRSPQGTCYLTEFTVESAPAAEPAKRAGVKFARATADYSEPESPLGPRYDDKSGRKALVGPVAFAIDGKNETAWGIDAGPGRRNVEHVAVFALEKPIENPGGSELTIHLKQDHGGWNSDDLQSTNLGRFRLSVTDAPDPAADPVPRRILDILAIARDRRSPAQVAALFTYWRTTVPEWKAANDRIEALWKTHPEGGTTLVLQAKAEPRITNLLRRGDFLKPVKPVAPGVPGFLHQLPADAPPTRLTLARWLVDRQAPTTARAFVNRAWQAYFGTGLLATSEDFGTQAEAPSHPELLDWLACEFMDRGWSVKALHRLIVTSATYRQASRVTPDLNARDPYNRLLARGARLRVEGEVVRDIQLAASGLLNPALGGRSVMPPAPAFLFQPPASYSPFPWVEETGPDRYRRAVYTWRRRSTFYPMLAVFDVPQGDTSCVRRSRSNTPLQALMTLNETLAMESARALARRALADGGPTDPERITYAFRRCVGRPPTDAERSVLVKLLDAQRQRFDAGNANAWETATGAKTERPADLPAGSTPAQLAAYTLVSRVLLNLDETITKE